MKLKILALLVLLGTLAFGQQAPPSGFVQPIAQAAYTPFGTYAYLNVNGSGSLVTTPTAGVLAQISGFVQPYAPVAQDSNGLWHFLLVDATGALKISASGGGGANITVNGGSNLTSPVNFQNGTIGNVINFSNPAGSNIQATIQAAAVTNAMLVNAGTTVNSQTCTLGSACTIPEQVNGSNLTSQAGFNLLTSTVNTDNLTVTPTNTATNSLTFEISGTTNTGGGGTGLSNPTANSLMVAEGNLAFTLVTSPAVNGFYTCGFNVTASAKVDPTCALAGIGVTANSGNYSLNTSTDRSSYQKISGGTTAILTLPQITGNGASNFPFVTQNLNSGNETLTANAADKIDNSATGGSATILPNVAAFVYQDSSSAPGNWWTIKLPTQAAFGAANSFVSTQAVTPNLYAADSGAVNAYVVTLAPPMTAYTTGVIGCFKAANASTIAAPTVNFNGLGAKTIVKLNNLALAGGDIGLTEPSCVIYDGANFDLLNPQQSTGAGGAVLTSSPTFITKITTPLIATTTKCAAVGTTANPSVVSCAAAPAGVFSCNNTTSGTCTVNTTAMITANSTVIVTEDDSTTTGTLLGVTCNATPSVVNPSVITAKVAATSFSFTATSATDNPKCFQYFIVN